MKRREFAVLSGRTRRAWGGTVVARRRGSRPSLPPSCDDAGWERLVILPPPGPFCSADSLLILGGLAIEGQPAGPRVRAYRGMAIASFNGHSAKDRARRRPAWPGRARPGEQPRTRAVALLRQRPDLLRAVHQPGPAQRERGPIRQSDAQLRQRQQVVQLPDGYRPAGQRRPP